MQAEMDEVWRSACTVRPHPILRFPSLTDSPKSQDDESIEQAQVKAFMGEAKQFAPWLLKKYKVGPLCMESRGAPSAPTGVPNN